MKTQNVSAIQIAMVYIGTVVGAGFATGQEILQFFVAFGLPGLWGIVLSTGLFILFGVMTMQLGLTFHARSHLAIVTHLGGGFFRTLMDGLILFSLFCGLTAMMAGTGALFEQQLGLPAVLGSFIMGALSVITVLAGLRGVISAISAIVPFLLLAVMGIGLYMLISAPITIPSEAESARGSLMGNWLLAALLYASYNIMMSISVLGPLGAVAKSKRAVTLGGALGGMGLGLASAMIYFTLSAVDAQTRTLEVPILAIAGRIVPIAGAFYAVILIAEVYTTAVGGLFGLSARLCQKSSWQTYSARVIICTAMIAFFASLFGFSNLVRYVYPLQGYGGFVLLLALILAKFRKPRTR